jgi:hypothetical protein
MWRTGIGVKGEREKVVEGDRGGGEQTSYPSSFTAVRILAGKLGIQQMIPCNLAHTD